LGFDADELAKTKRRKKRNNISVHLSCDKFFLGRMEGAYIVGAIQGENRGGA
jgi:hypothetical protein